MVSVDWQGLELESIGMDNVGFGLCHVCPIVDVGYFDVANMALFASSSWQSYICRRNLQEHCTVPVADGALGVDGGRIPDALVQ